MSERKSSQRTDADDAPDGEAVGSSTRHARRDDRYQAGVVSLAKHVATQVADHTRGLVGERVSERASKSVSDLNSLADALRLTGKQLEGNMTSPIIAKAADQVQRVGEMLGEMNGRDTLQAVERFAKREPTWFVGGALALGLIGARFLKSSGKRIASTERGTQESSASGEALVSNGRRQRRNQSSGRRDTRAQS
jgi:hypothetical protein